VTGTRDPARGGPEEIAESAVWHCSDPIGFATGESMLADRGVLAR
jgi:hypothetical protein